MPVKFDNKGFLNIRANIRQNFPDALLKGAQDIVDTASQLAPVGDGIPGGHLKDTGIARLTGTRTVTITFGEGLPDERAIAQEYGTAFMPAQPYLTPALNQVDILFHVRKAIGL